MGKSFKRAIKSVGKAVGGGLKFASPFAALIPGVGPLAAVGLGAAGRALGRALSGQKTLDVGDIARTGALAGLGGVATGGQGFRGLGNLGAVSRRLGALPGQLGRTGVGRAVTGAFTTPEGQIDLGRIAGAGLGAANILGARSQRKSAERQDQQAMALRNQLMSRILSSPQYNFQQGP